MSLTELHVLPDDVQLLFLAVLLPLDAVLPKPPRVKVDPTR